MIENDLKNQPSHMRIIRVFVSSTFRDMVVERDELMNQAWPEFPGCGCVPSPPVGDQLGAGGGNGGKSERQ